jgi:hypothetical protein
MMKRMSFYVVLLGLLVFLFFVSLPTEQAHAGLAFTNTPEKQAEATEYAVVAALSDATDVPVETESAATEAPTQDTELQEPTATVVPEEPTATQEVIVEVVSTATADTSSGGSAGGSISIELVSKSSSGVTYKITGTCTNSSPDPAFGTHTAKWSKSGRVTVRAYCKRGTEICAFAQKTFKSDVYPTSTPGATPTPRPHTTTTPICRACQTATKQPTATAVATSTSAPSATNTSVPTVIPTNPVVKNVTGEKRSTKLQGALMCVPIEQVLTGKEVGQYYVALINWDVKRDKNGAPADLVNPKDSTKDLGGYTTSAAFEGHNGCRQALFNQVSWTSNSLLYIQDFYGNSRHLVTQPNGNAVVGYMVSWRDPQWILYVSAKDGFVHRIHPDGTGDENLRVRGLYPINSEDGTKLAITTLDGYLSVGNADGTDMQVSSSQIANPKWLPDQSLVLGINNGSLKSHDLHDTTHDIASFTRAYVGDPGEESVGLIVSQQTNLYFLDQIDTSPKVLSLTAVEEAEYVDWVRPDADVQETPVQAAFVTEHKFAQFVQPTTVSATVTVTASSVNISMSKDTGNALTSSPSDNRVLNFVLGFALFVVVMLYLHFKWRHLVFVK